MKIYKLKNWLIILLISVASSGCTELYDESYNEIITLEQRIKRFESYSYRYLSDKISDVKGEPRTKL